MLLGKRTLWPYYQCGNCGCVQLANVPENLSDYYADDYPIHHPRLEDRTPLLRRIALRVRAHYVLTGRGQVGKLLCRLKGPPMFGQDIMKEFGIGLHDPILDVGCGSGDRLRQLAILGFTNLAGQDLFCEPKGLAEYGIRFFAEPLFARSTPWLLRIT